MKRMRLLKYTLVPIVALLLCTTCFSQVENRLNEAIRLSQNGEYDKADNIFTQILLTDPNNEKALIARGYNNAWNKHVALAEQDFKKVAELNPKNLDAVTGLAFVLSWSGKYKEADEKFNFVLGKSTFDIKALEGRAYNNLWREEYLKANHDFTMLTELADNPKKDYYTTLAKIRKYTSPWVYEAGGSLGAMNCLTDLGGGKGIGKKFVKDLNMKKYRPAAGVYFDAMYDNIVGIRAEATYGMVTAYDSILKKVANSTYGRFERNLSFRSSIIELVVIGEFHPLSLFDKESDDVLQEKHSSKASPYVAAGIGLFYFNPKAKLGNSWVALHPLHTEGEGFAEYPGKKNYKLLQVNFPVGLGMKYNFSKRFNMRAEFIYRVLRTDYLDDVSTTYANPLYFSRYLSGTRLSQALSLFDRNTELAPGSHTNDIRGDSRDKDAYFSFNIKAGIVLGRKKIQPEVKKIDITF